MDHHISIDGLPVLEAGFLKNGMPYEIVLLTPAHAAVCADLHAATIAGLAENEKAYMLPKSPEYFAEHLRKDEGNAVIAAVSGGELIGQAIIRHPTADHPETGMVDMTLPAPPEEISLLQAVSVAPAARGAGLMDRLIHQWVIHADSWDRGHLIAEIHVDNAPSWANFLRAGLNIVGIGHDPSDGTVVYNAYERTERALVKSLTAEFNRYAACPAEECAARDRERQEELMTQGYIIAGRNEDKTALVLRKVNGCGPCPL